MSEKIVDYMELVACFDAEERAGQDDMAAMPESAGEQVVDYLAVSERWK